MRKLTFFASVLGAALMVVVTSVPARATDIFTYDKLTYMTFSAPVQIPWATLSPGTYRFRLANPSTGRNVLQVLSDDGAIVYSMFHTIPDSRSTVTDESVVTFRETPAGMPPAIRSLFYGGERRGYEFIYPKGTIALVTERPQPEITYTPMVSAEAVETRDLATEAPEWLKTTGCAAPDEPCEEAVTTPELSAAIEPTAGFEPAGNAATLPGTASPLPLVALGGLASLVLGLGAGLARRRES